MSRERTQTVVACALLTAIVCATTAIARAAPTNQLLVVPRPRVITLLSGTYRFTKSIHVAAPNRADRNAASFLVAYLHGIGLAAEPEPNAGAQATVVLSSGHHEPRLGDEGYNLTVTSAGVRIDANTPCGVFYGVQTLEQLLPVGVVRPPRLPQVSIVDWPEYRWRGLHLDVSRHFFSTDVVKRTIDVAARFKLNTFHWHLTDDQAWRIALPRYPRLAHADRCRSTPEDCSYYTESELRDVVQYARRRFVTVVPELEMPAHADALLNAYPELMCSGGGDVLCPSEAVFRFIGNVLAAMAKDFPGSYVHMGGDEVPDGAWSGAPEAAALCRSRGFCTAAQIQGYFTRRVQSFARRHHRRIIVWDDALAGHPEFDAAIMAWRGVEFGWRAARLGYETVMTPQTALYFDAYQGSPHTEPRAAGGTTTLENVYDFRPRSPDLSRAEAANIIGVQGNLWTEQISTAPHLFYMLLPRALALAEIAWTPPSRLNWPDFERRLLPQLRRLSLDRYPYRKLSRTT